MNCCSFLYFCCIRLINYAMSWMGLFIFSSICDALSSIGEETKYTPRGKKASVRYEIYSILIVAFVIMVIILFFYILTL